MSRWREPREKSSPYITAEGYAKLEAEQQDLWRRRAEVTKAVTAAAAEGDRSENAEYIYRKKELRGIDSRIAYLQKRMPDLKIVNNVSMHSKIFFGAWVTLENDEGEEFCYRIVGADELDGGKDRISVDSPLARALLGTSVDKEISLSVGKETRNYYIVAIHYSNLENDEQS
jgi:transcription elongation factor GreB